MQCLIFVSRSTTTSTCRYILPFRLQGGRSTRWSIEISDQGLTGISRGFRNPGGDVLGCFVRKHNWHDCTKSATKRLIPAHQYERVRRSIVLTRPGWPAGPVE